MVRKTNFLSISVLFSEIVIFCLKRKLLYEFSPKSFKTTKSNSLAVCDSLFVEKEFLFMFIPFHWFNQKQLFKQIQIFLRFDSFKHVRKKKIQSILVLVSAIKTFMSK